MQNTRKQRVDLFILVGMKDYWYNHKMRFSQCSRRSGVIEVAQGVVDISNVSKEVRTLFIKNTRRQGEDQSMFIVV